MKITLFITVLLFVADMLHVIHIPGGLKYVRSGSKRRAAPMNQEYCALKVPTKCHLTSVPKLDFDSKIARGQVNWIKYLSSLS